MKRLKFSVIIALCALAVSSCKLDNYDAPNASVYGSILDVDGGANVYQDIYNGGTVEFVEEYGDGTQQPDKRALVLMTNGTYRNNLMFAGTYSWMYIQNGNYIPETVETNFVLNKGENKFDIEVTPLCRIKDCTIQLVGNKIVAKFKIEIPAAVKAMYDNVDNQALDQMNYYVNMAGLWGHMTQLAVGQPTNIVNATKTISQVEWEATYKNPAYEHTYEINLPQNTLVSGQTYYFRAGARVRADNSKFNYGTLPVAITIP